MFRMIVSAVRSHRGVGWTQVLKPPLVILYFFGPASRRSRRSSNVVVLTSHLRDDDAARWRRLRPALANGRNSAGLVKRAELRPGIEVGMIRRDSIRP